MKKKFWHVFDIVKRGKSRAKKFLYQIKIKESDLDELDEIQLIAFVIDEDLMRRNLIPLIGTNSDLYIKENVVSSNFDGSWFAFSNGEYAPLIAMYSDDQYEEYFMPCIYNGRKGNMRVIYDFDNDEFEIIGISEGIDPETQVASKRFYSIKKGDTIQPIYMAYDTKKDDMILVEGDEFKIDDDNLEIGFMTLTKGQYALGFMAYDFAQNLSTTEPTIIDISYAEDDDEKEDPIITVLEED